MVNKIDDGSGVLDFEDFLLVPTPIHFNRRGGVAGFEDF